MNQEQKQQAHEAREFLTFAERDIAEGTNKVRTALADAEYADRQILLDKLATAERLLGEVRQKLYLLER